MKNRVINHKQATEMGLYSTPTTIRMNLETANSAPPVVQTPTTKNFLSFIEAQNHMTSGAATALYTKLINALSSRIADHLRWHVVLRRAGKLDNDIFEKMDEERTLDVRNEQDEYKRGEELAEYLTNAAGHTVRMPHLKAAGILNGIRLALYDKLAAFTDLPDPKVILFRMPKGVEPKTLRAFPMGIELALRGMIEREGTPTDAQLKQAAEKAVTFKRTTEAAVKAAQDEAKRRQQQLMSLYADILTEADSLPNTADEDDWLALDQMEREVLVSRVKNNLSRAAEQAFARASTARPGSSWEKLHEELLVDVEHAQSVVEEFIAANPFELIESTSQAKVAIEKLGGTYKPKSVEDLKGDTL